MTTYTGAVISTLDQRYEKISFDNIAKKAPAGNQADKGRGQGWGSEIVRAYVALNMVYRHQRQSCGKAEPLHTADAGQQRADQPRAIGYGAGVNIGKRQAGLRKRWSITWSQASTCARLAISGTTPPYRGQKLSACSRRINQK